MLFLRVIVWCGAEKFSLKKSCFYLYIRRDTFSLRSASTAGQRSNIYDKGTTYAPHCQTWVGNHYIAALISISLDLYQKAIQRFLQPWLVQRLRNLQRMADLMKKGI